MLGRPALSRSHRTASGGLMAVALLALFSSHCGDGTVRPLREEAVSVTGTGTGGSASGGAKSTLIDAGGVGGGGRSTGGTSGTGGAVATSTPPSDCVTAEWPDAAVEDDLLNQLNGLRTTGVTCGWGAGFPVAPLASVDALRCAARVHSMTAFSVDIVESATARVVTFYSPPTEQLDVAAVLFDLVMTAGEDCWNLLSPMYAVAGVGFSSDGVDGYFTVYLEPPP